MSDRVFRDGPARYAIGQLERALEAAVRSGDAAAQARAGEKVRRWRHVLDGMASGRITVGSRTPVADLPAWVTLEVAHGGFATGHALSEVPLTVAESEVLARLPQAMPGETDRERLNLWYLGDDGRVELLNLVASGRFRIEMPEDAALAIVVLLLHRGFPEQALDLIAELRPFMARLRFTPVADAAARPAGAAVRVTSVGEIAEALRAVVTPEQLTLMRATVEVWTPLYDRLVALWCATVDGDLPRLGGAGAVLGGWPCRTWPAAWADERARWLDDFTRTCHETEFRGRYAHRKSNFTRLHEALLGCGAAGAGLTARQVGWIRLALANTITRHGEPGSAVRESVRTAQAGSVSAPLYADLAAVLATRLDRYPVDGGLPSLDPVAVSISPAEQETVGTVAGRTIPAGTPIPQHLQDKAIRALEAPVEELIGHGIIGSGEMLAAVVPQLTATVLAADMTDPDVVELYEQLYTAFRRRRSLLLIDLAHQVRFSELPWVMALDPLRRNRNDTSSQTTAARALLRQIAVVAIESFPHAVLPNPLVREFGALARSSGLDLPLVEEVAADIFTGTFTEKWRAAAVTASRVLHDTVYQAYYDLPTTSQWDVQRRTLIRWNKATALDFTALCEQRAAEAGTGDNYVARNGAVLEQSQILTTHNLSALVQALELERQLREIAPDAAQRTFDWILQRLSQPAVAHAALIQVKNAAYAWRQAIFLLSYCDQATQHAHLHRLSEHTTGSRLAPAVAGLIHILDGGRFTPDGLTPDGVGRRFLGWAVGKHWYFR